MSKQPETSPTPESQPIFVLADPNYVRTLNGSLRGRLRLKRQGITIETVPLHNEGILYATGLMERNANDHPEWLTPDGYVDRLKIAEHLVSEMTRGNVGAVVIAGPQADPAAVQDCVESLHLRHL